MHNLPSFGEYTCSLECKDATNIGEVIIYSFNNYKLDKETITDNIKPSIYATMPNGLVNQLYVYDEALAYDVMDGISTPSVNIYSPDNILVSTQYIGFVPKKTGTYRAVFNSENTSGGVAQVTREFVIYESMPQFNFVCEKEIEERCNKGDNLYIPKAFVFNELLGQKE